MNLEIAQKQCTVENTSGIKIKKVNCLKIIKPSEEIIYLVEDKEYRIKFYNEICHKMMDIKGKPEVIWRDQINFAYYDDTTDKYKLPKTIDIPLNNIIDIEELGVVGV